MPMTPPPMNRGIGPRAARPRVALAGMMLAILLASAAPAAAQTGPGQSGAQTPDAPPADRAAPFFGYTSGSGMLPAKSWALLAETSTRFDKIEGDYIAFREKIAFIYGVDENFSIGAATTFQHLDIEDVPDLPDRDDVVFEGLSANIKVRLLDAKKSGFGLAVEVTPQWTPRNPNSGIRETNWLAELKLGGDVAIVPDRFHLGANVKYTPGVTRRDGAWVEGSALEVGTSLVYTGRKATIGIETRRATLHNGLALGNRLGSAVYIGPIWSIALSKKAVLAGTLGFQVDGKPPEGGIDRGLDLVAFERRQGLLRLSLSL